MFCSTCGKTLKGDQSLCPHCGAAVGESRFEGHTYTGTQMRMKPGEAVRLPVSHTKTTYMGKKTAPDEEADARTTYRATAEKVYGYEEFEEGIYDEPDTYDSPDAEPEEYGEADEDAASYEAAPAPEDTQEAAPEADEPVYDATGDEESDEPVYDAVEDDEIVGEEPDAYESEPDSADNPLEDYGEDEEPEEEPVSRRKKRLSRKERRILEEDRLVDEELGKLTTREIRIDSDANLEEEMRRYEASGRYDDEPEEEAPAAVKKEKKRFDKKFFSFKKRSRDIDFDSLTPDDLEIAEEENPFDIDDLPEEAPEAADTDAEYGDEYDEAFADEEFGEEEEEFLDSEQMDMDEISEEELDEMQYRENGRGMDPKLKGILKYAAAAVVLVAIVVGAIIGLGSISNKTKKAPIDGVTLELYEQGVELMKKRASDDYRNNLLAGYDGSMPKMIAVTDAISRDLDAINGMMPENPLVYDQTFIAAMTAIQNNINASITNDLLAYSDSTKTESDKKSESAQRWLVIEQTVEAFANATSTAQLDAIIKGEKIEVIQQTTPAPAATATPVPYTTLSKGSEGNDVRKLQTRLSELGYLTGTVDGIFGNQTKTAIQLFQKAIGYEVTGIADADTQIALFSDDAPRK